MCEKVEISQCVRCLRVFPLSKMSFENSDGLGQCPFCKNDAYYSVGPDGKRRTGLGRGEPMPFPKNQHFASLKEYREWLAHHFSEQDPQKGNEHAD